MFSANVKRFILTAHTHSMPICVPVPACKVGMRRLDAVDDMFFSGSMSRTRIAGDRLKMVLLHAVQNWLCVPRFLRVLRIFHKQMHSLARGIAYCICFNPRGQPCTAAVPGRIALPPRPPPKHRARPPPLVPPPLVQPRVVQAPAPDDSSIAIDSCDSDRDIHCDAHSVASFEALDEAEHIGVHTQHWD